MGASPIVLASDPPQLMPQLLRAYQQLKSLQGDCVPVFEAAGCLSDDTVVVAVSGGQRLGTSGDRQQDQQDCSHEQRCGSLIH